MSDDAPDMHIDAEWFEVEITDKQSAEAAFGLVQEVFVQYLGKAPQAGSIDTEPEKTQVYTQCPDCGYKWIFNGKYPTTATCPQCSTQVNCFENEIETEETTDE